MDWLVHEGNAIFWSVFLDEKMMNVANDPKRSLTYQRAPQTEGSISPCLGGSERQKLAGTGKTRLLFYAYA